MKEKLMLLGLFLIAVITIPLTINSAQKQQKIYSHASNTSGVNDSTVFTLNIFLNGIGNSGDSTNPGNYSLSNKTPQWYERDITISFYNTSGQFINKQTGYIDYDNQNGWFTGNIDMGTKIPTDDYVIKVKTDGYLQKRIPGNIHVEPGSEIILPSVSLVAGDFNGDNKIDIIDYNMFMGCYSDFLPAAFCDDTKKRLTDLSSDGMVDLLDYNLFLREISVQNGD